MLMQRLILLVSRNVTNLASISPSSLQLDIQILEVRNKMLLAKRKNYFVSAIFSKRSPKIVLNTGLKTARKKNKYPRSLTQKEKRTDEFILVPDSGENERWIRREKTPRKMTDRVEFSPDPVRLGRSFNGGERVCFIFF
jgi:hypothetical protein